MEPELSTKNCCHLVATSSRTTLKPVLTESYYSKGLWWFSSSVVSSSLRPHALWPARLFCPWGFPGKNTGVGSHFLLQGIFPNSEIEPRSPALQADALTSEPPGKPAWRVDVLNYVLRLGQIPGTLSPWSLPLGQASPVLKETAGPSTGQCAKNSWPLCPAGSPL